jgi:RNA polymerase-binding transcription factor DksA
MITTEVTTMNAMQEKLFLELRQTKEEIICSLKRKHKQNWFTSILEEELADIDVALQKIENGKFGQCEISGEFLPDGLLKMIPTVKSLKDSEYLEVYYKKSIY